MEKTLLELEHMTNIPDKITVIVPTSSSPLWMFQLMVLSMYFRLGPEVCGVIFVVNGDGPEQQKKLHWLCQLRNIPLFSFITITVQGSVGHSQALDCALPWVRTELVASFHDDTVITDKDWSAFVVQRFRSNPSLGMLVSGWCGFDGQSPWEGKTVLHKEHPATDFVCWRKSVFTDAGAMWRGYHADFSDNCVVSRDIGYWACKQLTDFGWAVEKTDTQFHVHFVAGSWSEPDHHLEALVKFQSEVREVQRLIGAHPVDLHYSWPMSQLPTVTYEKMVEWHDLERMHIHQNFFEFRNWLLYLEQLQPTTLLEIGTYKWGTAQMVLSAIPSIKKLVTVDIVDRLAEKPEILAKYGGRLSFVHGDTREPETWARIECEFGNVAIDSAFIDGDHDYRPTMFDFSECTRMVKAGGLVGFHDVHPECGAFGSVVVFQELMKEFPNKASMIDCSAEKGPWGNYGIGVYRCI